MDWTRLLQKQTDGQADGQDDSYIPSSLCLRGYNNSEKFDIFFVLYLEISFIKERLIFYKESFMHVSISTV